MIDLTGQRFGSRVVLERAPARPPATGAQWAVSCDCGTRSVVQGSNLLSGIAQRCRSCSNEDRLLAPSETVNTPTWNSWRGMKTRCTNPSDPNWKRYGGRGITLDPRWEKFPNFLADMGERPEGMSIDRINNDGNYEPGNCRWADSLTQRYNR